MAITAETRTDIIDLVVAALDVAPGTTLLNELVALVDGGGTLADVAANLTARTDYQAKYPAFQTSTEWATEWLGNLIPEADTATNRASFVAIGPSAKSLFHSAKYSAAAGPSCLGYILLNGLFATNSAYSLSAFSAS